MTTGSVLAAFDRPASRQERFQVELGKGIHDAQVMLATSTEAGRLNAWMGLCVLAERLREVFGPSWFEEARERGLLAAEQVAS